MHHNTAKAIENRFDQFAFKIETLKDNFEHGEDVDLIQDSLTILRGLKKLASKDEKMAARIRNATRDFNFIIKLIDQTHDKLEVLQDYLNIISGHELPE